GFGAAVAPDLVAFVVVDDVLHHIDAPLRAEDVVVHVDRAVVLLAAAAERLHAVGIFIDHSHVVEDVPVFWLGAGLPAARAAARDGILVPHRPGRLVEAVDVLFDVEIARQPREVEPVANLPFHVGPAGLPRVVPQAVRVVAGLHGDDVADRALVDLGKRGPHSQVVAVAQPGHDREPFRFSQLTTLDHRADAPG